MDTFANSVLARMHGRAVPEGGYPGQYVADIAEAIRAERPALAEAPEDEARAEVRDRAYALQMADIRSTLQDFGVHFDVWFSEASLHASGAIEKAVARLREQGHVYEDGGAAVSYTHLTLPTICSV